MLRYGPRAHRATTTSPLELHKFHVRAHQALPHRETRATRTHSFQYRRDEGMPLHATVVPDEYRER